MHFHMAKTGKFWGNIVFAISILVYNMPNTSFLFWLYVEINGEMFSPTSFCVSNKVFLGFLSLEITCF